MARPADAAGAPGGDHAATMTRKPRPTHRPLALATLLLALAPAAQALCWIDAGHPATADGNGGRNPQAAPMRQIAERVHAIVKGNAAMRSLEDTRVRSRWQIGGPGDPAWTLWYQARDHRRSMWVGECGVLEGADRLPARASVVVQVNGTSDLFNGPPEIDDEGLRAWREPTVVAQVQGRPLYFGWQLVLTPSGRPPWVPVSNAEFLDFAAREIARQQAGGGGPTPYWQQQREALARHRATLDAAALAAPARAGWVWQHPGVPAERWPLLVKLDPAFPWDRARPQRAQIITLKIQGADAQAATMQRVLNTIDLAAFESMLQAR